MKIGALASLTGVSIRMLRYYEQEGLLKPQRAASGYRLYGAAEVKLIEAIILLNDAGLTLSTIKDVLECAPAVTAASAPLCDVLRDRIWQQVAVLDQKAVALERSREMLISLLGPGRMA